MSIESKLAGINVYYSTHITFILETVISTMLFWGYNTTSAGDGSIKAIKDRFRTFYFPSQESKQEPLTTNKLEKIDFQINQKPETIKDHILKMGLIYFFSLFEAFNKDFFQTLFKFKPELMKTKDKHLNYEELLNFSDIDELYECIIQEEINSLGYLDIDQIAEILIGKFKINLKEDFEYWKQLRENYYRRNIIVHNDGKISEIYLRKMFLGKGQLNEELKCDIEYLRKCHNNIQSYLDFIDDSIRKKFNLKSRIESL